MLEIRQFAVEMALRGPGRNTRSRILVPALRAWKAAQNAAFHIPTATATAGSRLTKCKKPAKPDSFFRFSRRTEKSKACTVGTKIRNTRKYCDGLSCHFPVSIRKLFVTARRQVLIALRFPLWQSGT